MNLDQRLTRTWVFSELPNHMGFAPTFALCAATVLFAAGASAVWAQTSTFRSKQDGSFKQGALRVEQTGWLGRIEKAIPLACFAYRSAPSIGSTPGHAVALLPESACPSGCTD